MHANTCDSQRITLGSSEPPLGGIKSGKRPLALIRNPASPTDLSAASVSVCATDEDFNAKRRRLQSRVCRYVPIDRPPDGLSGPADYVS